MAQAEARNAGRRKLISDTRTVVSTDAELGVLARHVLRETLDADSARAKQRTRWLGRSAPLAYDQSFMHGRDPESVVALGVLEHGAAPAVLGAGNELFRLERDSAGMRPMGKPSSPVFRMAVAPDGARFAVALEGSVLWILRSADGALEKAIRLDGDVFDLAWSPDGRVLATATAGGGLTLWDAASSRRVRDLGAGAAHWFNVLDFSPDGTLLAAADSDGAVRIWSTADGTMRQEICGSGDRMDAVRFDPTGRFLATTSSYYVVMLWTVEEHPGGAPCTSSPLRRFIGHFNTVFDLAFAPDGQTLATASADTTVRLWEASTGDPARPRRPPEPRRADRLPR